MCVPDSYSVDINVHLYVYEELFTDTSPPSNHLKAQMRRMCINKYVL